MVYPYDNPEQWQAGFPAGWNPQQVLMQALQNQPGGLPVMPQAVRGGISGQAQSTPSTFTPMAAPQMQGQAPMQGAGGAPAPAYYGPTHQALSTALQGALTQQAQTPGLLSEQMQHGNWPTWQEKGGLYNNLYAPVHGYSRVDWINTPDNNALVHQLNQAREANVRYGTPIPPGLEQQVLARQQAAPAAQAAPQQQVLTPEMRALLLAQQQAPQQPPQQGVTWDGGQ